MTKQEYKELLIKTSLEGGFPCNIKGTMNCLYRSSEGKKCAVGLLIPDEKYKTSFEGSLLEYVVENGVGDNIPIGLNIPILSSIQLCHDDQVTAIHRKELSGWDHNLFVSDITQILGD